MNKELKRFQLFCKVKGFCEEYKRLLPADFDVQQYYRSSVEIGIYEEDNVDQVILRTIDKSITNLDLNDLEDYEIFIPELCDLIFTVGCNHCNSKQIVYFVATSTIYGFAGILSTCLDCISKEEGMSFFMEGIDSNISKQKARLCFEYRRENFNKIMSGILQNYFSGDALIVGLGINGPNIHSYLKKYLLNKSEFAELLKNPEVIYWWYCHRDMDRLNLWVKGMSSDSLLSLLKGEKGSPKGKKGKGKGVRLWI